MKTGRICGTAAALFVLCVLLSAAAGASDEATAEAQKYEARPSATALSPADEILLSETLAERCPDAPYAARVAMAAAVLRRCGAGGSLPAVLNQLEAEGDPFTVLFAPDLADQDVHGEIIQPAVVRMNGGKAGTGELRAGEVVKAADQHVPWNADAALLQGFHQAERHFVIGADKGVGQGAFLPEPAPGGTDAVAGPPGALDDLQVSVRDAVVPARFQETVQPLAAFRTAVVHVSGQIDETPGAVLKDDVLRHPVLCLFVVEIDKGTALQAAAYGDGGDTALCNDPLNLPAGFPEDDLVSLDQQAVKRGKLRQLKDGVFTFVLGVSEVLAETVEHTNLHVRMVHGVLQQAVERVFHQFIVPVDGQERDPEPALRIFHNK